MRGIIWVMEFFRIQWPSAPAETILDQDTWESRVWDGWRGRPCGTCHGQCLDRDDVLCEDCRGAGEVEDVRHGVSAALTVTALYDYFAGRDAELAGCSLVTFDGDFAADDDLDADDGAVLTYPRRIIAVVPLDPRWVEWMTDGYAETGYYERASQLAEEDAS